MSKKSRKLKKLYKKELDSLNEDYIVVPNEKGMKKLRKGLQEIDKAEPVELIDRDILRKALKMYGLKEEDIKVGC